MGFFSVLFTSLRDYLCDIVIGNCSFSRTKLNNHLETPRQEDTTNAPTVLANSIKEEVAVAGGSMHLLCVAPAMRKNKDL